MAAGPRLRLATRGSPLARWQAERVASRLEALGADVETVVVSTTGDRAADEPLAVIGGQGVFVKEVQEAVLGGRADAAVHSAKDLPGVTPEGLVVASVPERADPRDVLVGSTLEGLPTGATVATGSARRRAQLAWTRPDLTFVDLRGNMARRLERSAEVGAGVLAVAALIRLGLEPAVMDVLDPAVVLPQVGQGAIAVECRGDDDTTRALLAAIDDEPAHRAVRAERAFLAELGGGCTLPLAAHAPTPPAGDPSLELTGMLASRDGHVQLRHRRQGADPEALGAALAADLLETCGGRWLDDWSDR